ncbi:MAG: hypothetical protein IJH91_03045 [Mogibacterium sp.]|nr:hypothetical protein [Mogibacterium sp.]
MKEQVIEKIKALIDAPTANDALRLAASNYLDVIGTVDEKPAAEALLRSLDENVNSIDESLGFFKSDAARGIFSDKVDGMIASFEAAKANGETHCLCPACQLGKEIYNMRDELLK